MVAPFTALFAHDALRLANGGPGQRVLDVGAGTGVLSLAAATLGAEVLATVFSPGMIDCRIFRKTTCDRSFWDCVIPATVMTVDLAARRPWPIATGSLWGALMAALAIPVSTRRGA